MANDETLLPTHVALMNGDGVLLLTSLLLRRRTHTCLLSALPALQCA